MTKNTMEASIIYDTHLPDALRRAIEYAGDEGYVASMPQLLKARSEAPFENEIWNNWFFTANSEESTVTSPQGNNLAIFIHGGGIFSTPERFRKLYLASVNRHSLDGFTGIFGAKILPDEAEKIQEGKLPNGKEIPMYSFNEIKKGVNNLPHQYGIIMDFEIAKNSVRGFASFEELAEDPIMIARAGGIDQAAKYLEKAKIFYGTEVMGSWHRYQHVDPKQPQTWVQFVYDCIAGASGEVDKNMRTEGVSDIWFTHYRISRDAGFGIRADTAMINTARYVAVAPRNISTSVRNLEFGT